MTPIPLEEDLEKELMKMPELEDEKSTPIELKIEKDDREIIKRMNDINTFQCCDGELCLRGTDEMGKDFTVWWDAYDFLDWINTENVDYIKEQIIKHIKSK